MFKWYNLSKSSNLIYLMVKELLRFFSLLIWRKLTRRGARLLARHTFFCQFFFKSEKKIEKKKIFRSNNNFPLGLNINRAVKKDDWAVYKRQHFEEKKQKKNYFGRKFGQTVRQWTFKIRRWSKKASLKKNVIVFETEKK